MISDFPTRVETLRRSLEKYPKLTNTPLNHSKNKQNLLLDHNLQRETQYTIKICEIRNLRKCRVMYTVLCIRVDNCHLIHDLLQYSDINHILRMINTKHTTKLPKNRRIYPKTDAVL